MACTPEGSIIRRIAFFATFVLALCIATSARSLGADQTSPQGLTAHGTIVGQATLNGTKLNLGGDIVMKTRGKQLRLDLLKLGVPGTDATLNALITSFLPQGGITLVLDQGTGGMTIWSDVKRKYYVFKAGSTATPAPSPQPSASDAPNFGGTIVEMLETGKFFKDYTVFSESVQLGARSTVNGHPASNVHVSLRTQKRGGKLSDTTADIALAEDDQYLPVRISANVKPQNVAARIDFTQISPASPDPSEFAVPSGYTEASDPSEIFGATLPH